MAMREWKGRRGRPLIYGHAYGNASADYALEGIIERLRGASQQIEGTLPAIASTLSGFLVASIAAGTDAYGEPWKLTHKGAVPLRNAAKATSVAVSGSRIIFGLSGVEVAHHIGFARGYGGGTKLRRPIIPEQRTASSKHVGSREKGIPKQWQTAIREIIAAELGLTP